MGVRETVGVVAICWLVALGPLPAVAIPLDRAAVQIDVLDRALTVGARAGSGRERAAILDPAVNQTFNIGVMSAFIVGARWATMAPPDRSAVSAALRRYMVARLVSEFDNASATFAIDPVVPVRGADKMVRTTVTTPGEAPARLDYRMREYSGTWKVIDIYYNGVSELTTQRADLASSLASGGATALARQIDATTARLAR